MARFVKNRGIAAMHSTIVRWHYISDNLTRLNGPGSRLRLYLAEGYQNKEMVENGIVESSRFRNIPVICLLLVSRKDVPK